MHVLCSVVCVGLPLYTNQLITIFSGVLVVLFEMFEILDTRKRGMLLLISHMCKPDVDASYTIPDGLGILPLLVLVAMLTGMWVGQLPREMVTS